MKREAFILVLLIAIAGGVQGYMIWQAVTPAKDSVRFVAIAQRMAQEGTLATLRDESEHPLYPFVVSTAHPLVESLRGPQPDNWVLAAQWSAALPLVLCVLPLYLLLRTVLRPGAAAVGTLLFTASHEFAALGGGALADGWAMFFTCVFLWAVANILLRSKADSPKKSVFSAACLALAAGVSLGLAASAHQLAFVSGASALVMATLLIFKTASSPLAAARRLTVCGVMFSLGLAAILGSWLLLAEVKTTDAAMAKLLGRETEDVDEIAAMLGGEDADETEPVEEASNAAAATGTSQAAKPRVSKRWSLQTGEAMAFDKKDPTLSLRRHGFGAAISEFGKEITHAFGFALGGLAIMGLVLQLRSFGTTCTDPLLETRRPVPTFFTGFFALYVIAMLFAASRFGYLEERHLLPAVLVAIPLAAEAAEKIALSLSKKHDVSDRQLVRRRLALAGAVAVGCFLVVFPLIAPLHASHQPHRQAALWMAEKDRPAGCVLDTCGWTQFYSGRNTHLLSAGRKALKDPELRYIVLERRELEFESTRAATLRELVETSPEPVATFESQDGKHGKDVLVFEWNAERFATRKTRVAMR